MTDDDSNDRSGGTWYGRLRRVLKGEAATRSDLLDWLRESHAQTVLDADELAMLEGVLAVSETRWQRERASHRTGCGRQCRG